jgi:hypothetical protein
MKKSGILWMLLSVVLLAVAIVQCGGDTTSTSGTLDNGDGGVEHSSAPPPGGW